jgi:hypothetical protein
MNNHYLKATSMKRNSICVLLKAAVMVEWMMSPCMAFAPMVSSFPKNTAAASPCPSLLSLSAAQNDWSASLEDRNQHSRRSILRTVGTAVITTTAACTHPRSALAIPMASVDEFGIILRDSPLSVQVVEFSGPKGENVLVRLVDGTTFGIKDIIESSTDPRSPLKVSAACREVGVKTRFVDLEAILATAPKKKKMYTNQRVQEAQEKERARLERIQKDEEDRLAQLARMELEEQVAASK